MELYYYINYDDNSYCTIDDCLEYLATLESNSIDCVITDPPYFIDKLDHKWSADRY